MRMPLFVVTIALLGAAPAAPAAPRPLSFEQRVEAQRAIERVYYSHQIGASLPFDEAVPRSVLEKKVRAYLKESAALGKFWGTSITAEMLHAEVDRISRSTRFPQRLKDLYAALGNDSLLIQETFARATLAGRLTRSFFSTDERFHREDGRREEWDEWWLRAQESLDEAAVEAVASTQAALVSTGPSIDCDEVWDNGSLDDLPDPRSKATAVWTGSVAIFWGGGDYEISNIYDPGSYNTGGRYDPLTDSWAQVSTLNAPLPRFEHTAIWTGTEMIVWGGYDDVTFKFFGDGGRYDPVTDSWAPLPAGGAPSPRRGHSAVWTGSSMIVWGGQAELPIWENVDTGGRYSPGSDAWTPLSTANAPPARSDHHAVWTGSEMVVVAGSTSFFTGIPDYFSLRSGGRYDPVSDVWSPTAIAPVGYDPEESAVWTGSEVILWGPGSTGRRYRPSTDTWTLTSTVGAPAYWYGTTAVWTGSEMIVWGCCDRSGTAVGRYNPATDSWVTSAPINTPTGRRNHAAVWTGSQMLVWGGFVNEPYDGPTNTGGRYDPARDSWTPTSTGGAPPEGFAASLVWTGSLAIVWGRGGYRAPQAGGGGRYDPLTDGWSPISSLGPTGYGKAVWTGTRMVVLETPTLNGGRYDPVADVWAPVSAVGAPAPRREHSMLSTGSEVIVWGGTDITTYPNRLLDTGGRYDPVADTWAPIATAGAPEARVKHTAVWNGSEMIVWGGAGSGYFDTGGRYNPASDTWTPLTAVGAPAGRVDHSAVWTGTEMIVWGGEGSGYLITFNSGGRYNPASDTWTPLPTTGAPAKRVDHSAVWTGAEMIVWGGGGSFRTLNDGSRYDPATDKWSATSTGQAPSPRTEHAAVWIGDGMLVWGGWDYFALFNSGGLYIPEQAQEPPRISVGVGPSVLWPPNHRMVDVHADVRAEGGCGSLDVVLESIVSSDPDEGDIEHADSRMPDFDFRLRAELDANGQERTYAITYRATDPEGNTAMATAYVTVRSPSLERSGK